MAAFLHEEMGVDDSTSRVRAAELVEQARESFARVDATRSWSWTALRGILGIAAGVIFLRAPIESLAAIILVLGAWILVDGVIILASAIRHRAWALLPEGAIGLLIGYLILTRPGGAMLAFFVLTAAWALARGASEIGGALTMARGEAGRGMLLFVGVVSFAFGLVLLIAPLAGVVALGVWIGVYAVTYGVLSVIRSLTLGRRSSNVGDVWHGRPGAALPAS
jgi:uncharacterized membrane protein HdeD (DUF308 family)